MKITFRNSWLEYLIAIAAAQPLAFLLYIAILAIADVVQLTDAANANSDDIVPVSYLISIFIMCFLATKVVKHKLAKRERKT
jgi:hypothetical protein